MVRIFLNYRREDSRADTGRLHDRLSQHFGRNIFMDIDAIDPGLDFVEAIEKAVGSCDVLLAVIGQHWLTSTDPLGNRRLDNPEDFVRLEIMTALKRNIRVIPVLVGGAPMPRSTELPDVLQPLAHRQALVIDDHFHPDVDRLVEMLETVHGVTPTSTVFAPAFTNSIGIEFVLIPCGSFMMGSSDSDTDAASHEKPAHRVTISQPFYLGKYPVTQAQWEAVMGDNPSYFKDNPNYPVEHVRWDHAQAFLDKLIEQERSEEYHLPTEAQWEYACRAGTETPRYHPDINAIAWYKENSSGHPQPVGQKLPNAWGLYDMLGNVWELCLEGARKYTLDAAVDPMGPRYRGADSIHKYALWEQSVGEFGPVVRGGGWDNPAQLIRGAARNWLYPHANNLGFRCASSGRRR